VSTKNPRKISDILEPQSTLDKVQHENSKIRTKKFLKFQIRTKKILKFEPKKVQNSNKKNLNKKNLIFKIRTKKILKFKNSNQQKFENFNTSTREIKKFSKKFSRKFSKKNSYLTKPKFHTENAVCENICVSSALAKHTDDLVRRESATELKNVPTDKKERLRNKKRIRNWKKNTHPERLAASARPYLLVGLPIQKLVLATVKSR